MGLRVLTFGLIALYLMGCASTEKDYLVTISTQYGDMHAILYDETPKHKENFIKLSREGFYDSLLFHRVIENFMIQGGDPNSKGAKAGIPLGTGGPGYTIPAEFVPSLFHEKGALSAARQPDFRNPKKESNGSQFYIVQGEVYDRAELSIDLQKLNRAVQTLIIRTEYRDIRDSLYSLYEQQKFDLYQDLIVSLKDDVEEKLKIEVDKPIKPERLEAYTTVGGAPHLDDEYTVFGKVIDGLDIIDQIATKETDDRDRPVEDQMFSISVEEMSKRKIERKFDFTYPEK